MRDSFPFLIVLTLPIDAGPTDARIVLDGAEGSIDLFDASGAHVISLNITDGGLIVGPDTSRPLGIELGSDGFPSIFFDRDAGANAGFFNQFVFGNYAEFTLRISPPVPVGDGRATFIIGSERTAGSVAPTFRFRDDSSGSPNDILQADGGTTPDLLWLARSVPRGVLASGFQRATANDSARAPGASTDMTRTVALVSGRLYEVHLHSQLSIAAAGFNAIECDYDGNGIGQFFTKTILAAEDQQHIDSSVIFTASADDASAVFTVQNNSGSAGNIQLIAGADNPRTLTVFDRGKV